MQEKYSTILDFDSAVKLARKDPAAFEQYRLDAIEALINKAPERTQLHLRRLQWRIEQVRERSPSAAASCIKLYQMMWDSFSGRGGLIESLENAHNSIHSVNSPLPKAKVLDFSRTGETNCNSDH